MHETENKPRPGIGVSMPEIDYLVCGACQQDFPLHNIVMFMQHKKFDCDDIRSYKHVEGLPARLLLCKSCPRKFTTPWRLLQHAQRVHALLIYMEEEFSMMRDENFSANNFQVYTSEHQTSNAGIQTEDTPRKMDSETSLNMVTATMAYPTSTESQYYQQPLALDTMNSHVFGLETESRTVVDPPATHSTSHVTDVISDTVTNASQPTPQLSKPTHFEIDTMEETTAQLKQLVQDLVDTRNFDRDESGLLENKQHLMSVNTPVLGKNIEHRQSVLSCPPSHNEADEKPAVKSIEPVAETIKASEHEQKADVKSTEKDEEDTECCDNQACGITLMPGTHEEPKKCCLAEVPKKRKRHMQTKHMAGRRRAQDRRKRTGDTNVIIDIDSSLESMQNLPNRTLGSQNSNFTSTGAYNCITNQSTCDITTPVSSEKSVIIQPGTTFSIPVAISGSRAKTLPQFSILRSSSHVNVDQSTVEGIQASALDISQRTVSTQAQSGQGDHDAESHSNMSSSSEYSTSGNSMPTVSIGGVSYTLPRAKKRKYPTSRPYKCDQCDQAFNQRIHLRKHQSKHTGVKPFQCEQCDYSTVEKSHLKVHIRVHTGEKPFKCTYCEYATAQNSTLKIHLKRHHNQTCECSECGFICNDQPALENHVKENHESSVVETTDAAKSNAAVSNVSPGPSGYAVVPQMPAALQTHNQSGSGLQVITAIPSQSLQTVRNQNVADQSDTNI